MPARMGSILSQNRIVLCCGSGGVGKTTTSAAIAIRGALEGRKTIVLTIDPAKRLANSLGLESLGNEMQKIDLSSLGTPKGELWAMMLDTKRTFDELISKYAPNKESERRILENNIYIHLSSTLAGSQEYMAMEKLYEIYQEEQFDLIVVDTPPTRHALDFLEAPKKMTDFLDESVFKWFLMPPSTIGAWGLRLFSRGGALVMKAAERLTGLEPLQDLSEFLQNFQEMYVGFKNRAEEVSRFLRKPQTIFLLVTIPSSSAFEEARFFYRKLQEGKMPFGGFIVNRVNPTFHSPGVDHETLQMMIKGTSQISAETPLLQKFAKILDQFRSLGEQDRYQINQFMGQFEKPPLLRLIPYFSDDVHDLKGLEQINAYLFDKDLT